nr:hypothetical protein [Tanacetum cinerariifolium]
MVSLEEVASDDLRDALSVLYLTSAHLRLVSRAKVIENQAPPSPDYIPGLEEPEQAPPSPDYIPGPEHADDEIVAEDQPYAKDASPIVQSPEYVPESDFEVHPEDDDDEDPEEDHVDYLADGGDDKVVRLLAISSPPASPLSHWSSSPPHIPFPSLPSILSPPSPVLSPAPPPSPIHSLGYRAAMIRLRDEAVSTSSPPLQLPSASRREDRPEVTLPPQKRLGISLSPRYEIGESSSAAARPAGGFRADYGFVATVDREIMRDPKREVGYGITDSWDEIVETLQGAPVSTDTELGGYVREFETRVRQDTYEIYMRLDDEQTERQLLAVDTKLLSTPVSNNKEAYRLFRRNVPVTTLASGSVPARPTAYTLAGALFLPPWLPWSLTQPSAPLIVSIIGICRTPTVTCKMANFVVVAALRRTWTVVVIIAFSA